MVTPSDPSEIAVPSTPVALAAQLRVGAVGLTVTASVAVPVVLRLPSASFSVALAVRVKFASLIVVTARLDKVQPLTLIGVLPSDVAVCVPSLRTVPLGAPLIVRLF